MNRKHLFDATEM